MISAANTGREPCTGTNDGTKPGFVIPPRPDLDSQVHIMAGPGEKVGSRCKAQSEEAYRSEFVNTRLNALAGAWREVGRALVEAES